MTLSDQVEKKIIVLQLDDSGVPDFLTRLRYIDFTTYERGISELSHSLGYNGPQTPSQTQNQKSPRIVQAVFDSSLSSTDMYNELRRNVIDQKHVDQKFLYWNVDSAKKWVDICLCSHYPLYNRSIELLLNQFKPEILRKVISQVGTPRSFINMGVGSGQKDYIILHNMLQQFPSLDYVAIDLSFPMLQETIKHVYPLMEKYTDRFSAKCVIGDIEHLELYQEIRNAPSPRLFGFLGSNISNFWENRLLETFHEHLFENDMLMIEVDWIAGRKKEEITAGYSDLENQEFIWQPLAFLGHPKPDDWSSRFSFHCSDHYTDIPNSFTVVSKYKTDSDDIILSTSTKYDRPSFLRHLQDRANFNIVGEFSLNELFSVLLLQKR